jgi:colicin import membrane protein
MKPHWWLAVAWAAFGPAAVHALDAPAERTRIEAERRQVAQRFAAQEKACYGKFGVTDCIDAARKTRREALADLRRQEVALNDAERKDRAARRLRELEQRRRDESAASPPAEARVPRPLPEARIRERAPAEPKPPAITPQKAAENRKAYEQRVKEAEEHRQRAQARAAQRRKQPASELAAPAR